MNEQQAIEQAEKQWVDIYLTNDADKFAELLTDDFMYTSPVCEVVNRADYLQNLRDKTVVMDYAKASDTVIRVHGDAAIVTAAWGREGIISRHVFFGSVPHYARLAQTKRNVESKHISRYRMQRNVTARSLKMLEKKDALELARRFAEAISAGDVDRLDEIVADDYVQHNPGAPQGRDGLKSYFASIIKAFPDGKATVEDVITDGETLVGRRERNPHDVRRQFVYRPRFLWQ